MRIIARSTLRDFWSRPGRHDSEQPLKAWFKEVQSADWASIQDVRAHFRSASVLRGNRVAFNIAGNKYRLIVRINFAYRVVYIRFVGTHQEYDRIDAHEV